MIGSGLLVALACRDPTSRPEVEDENEPICHAGGAAFADGELFGTDDLLVEAADWEGDGDIDVFVQRELRTPLGLYENLGGGTWAAYRKLIDDSPTNASLTPIALLDLDLDGDADLLSALRSWTEPFPVNNILQWYERLQDGTLAAPRTIGSYFDCQSYYVLHDLTGDGDTDLLCSGSNGLMQWMERLGPAELGSPHEIQVSGSSIPADLDDDGDTDLLSAPYWAENSGATTFDEGHALPLDGWPYGWSGDPYVFPYAAGDPDGDGDTDVVGVVQDSYPYEEPLEYFGWWANVGGGVFAPLRRLGETPIRDPGGSWDRTFLELVDLDDDGDDDLLYGDAGVRWTMYEALGNGVVLESQFVIADSEMASTRTMAVDLDGDGHPDLLSDHHDLGETSSTNDGIYWYRSQLPHVPDADGDGNSDDCDTCPGTPDDVDADLDGVPDVCDRCPADAPDDSDGDGLCDSVDACLGLDVAGDTDEDGLCNDQDGCYGDNATGDTDLDHVCDDLDVCPGFPDIVDLDQDGTPDGCDDEISTY
jgi:hypothetical protein